MQPSRKPTSKPTTKSLYHQGVYLYGHIEQLVSSITGPADVFINSQGHMYISTLTGIIYHTSISGGSITAIAGGGAVTSGINIPATNAQFGQALGLCGDTAGNLYWSDFTKHVIWSYPSNSGGVINMIAGINGSPGYTTDGQPAEGNKIYSPIGIIIDTNGYLYWTERGNHLVHKAFAVNGTLHTIAGIHTASGSSGDNGPATSAILDLTFYLYLDTKGNLYISDSGNNKIRKINNVGIISLYAGGGTLSGNNIAATTALLNQPHGITGDSNGNIYFAASYYVYKVNTSHSIIQFVGNGVSSATLNNNVIAKNTSLSYLYIQIPLVIYIYLIMIKVM